MGADEPKGVVGKQGTERDWVWETNANERTMLVPAGDGDEWMPEEGKNREASGQPELERVELQQWAFCRLNLV